MFSRVNSAVCSGIEGRNVCVETDLARGLPGIFIVGLASTMIMESRERIRSAIVNSGLDYPRTRITVNLTPASLRKNGSGLDLPIAVGILISSLYIDPADVEGTGIVGELSLDGRVLGIKGLLPMLLNMQRTGFRKVIIPWDNRYEALLISGMDIYAVKDLHECMQAIRGDERFRLSEEMAAAEGENVSLVNRGIAGDYSEISGQETAKRAITVAVAGRHGLLMVGSPGCGKTMLSSRIPSIMPEMTEKELMETAVIYSATGKNTLGEDIRIDRPFRQPHHTIGRAGLIGGGLYPVPGEITLAHNGVLFLDEVCEFSRETIEALRTPLEEKSITHFRKGENYTFPSDFQLVMASNPCPCGYFGDPEHLCKCTEAQLDKYRKKLSGPLIDRIDMRINMEKVTYSDLQKAEKGTSSAEMREAVARAAEFAGSMGRTGWNASLNESETEKYCALSGEEQRFMNKAYDALKMSPRSYKRTLRVARTIADIDMSEKIRVEHLSEALSYRILDRINE